MGSWIKRHGATLALAIFYGGPLLAAGILATLREHPSMGLIAIVTAATFLVLLALHRLWLWRSVRSRMLHAAPKDHCTLCGYSSAGLETTHIDSGTLLFDRALCPECGRHNPR